MTLVKMSRQPGECMFCGTQISQCYCGYSKCADCKNEIGPDDGKWVGNRVVCVDCAPYAYDFDCMSHSDADPGL